MGLFARLHAWAVRALFGREGTDPVVILRSRVRCDKTIIACELGNNEAFVDIMPRSNVVRGQEEAAKVLRSDDETTEEIVDADEHRVQDLCCRHASDTAHKGLAKVAVQGKIEGKESPEGLVVAQKIT